MIGGTKKQTLNIPIYLLNATSILFSVSMSPVASGRTHTNNISAKF